MFLSQNTMTSIWPSITHRLDSLDDARCYIRGLSRVFVTYEPDKLGRSWGMQMASRPMMHNKPHKKWCLKYTHTHTQTNRCFEVSWGEINLETCKIEGKNARDVIYPATNYATSQFSIAVWELDIKADFQSFWKEEFRIASSSSSFASYLADLFHRALIFKLLLPVVIQLI